MTPDGRTDLATARPGVFGYVLARPVGNPKGLLVRWWPDGSRCSHANEDTCPTCDFDAYYRTNYEAQP